MTPRQQYIMTKVQGQIKIVRAMLEYMMYRSAPLPDNEYKKICEGYDLICQANDKLF